MVRHSISKGAGEKKRVPSDEQVKTNLKYTINWPTLSRERCVS